MLSNEDKPAHRWSETWNQPDTGRGISELPWKHHIPEYDKTTYLHENEVAAITYFNKHRGYVIILVPHLDNFTFFVKI